MGARCLPVAGGTKKSDPWLLPQVAEKRNACSDASTTGCSFPITECLCRHCSWRPCSLGERTTLPPAKPAESFRLLSDGPSPSHHPATPGAPAASASFPMPPNGRSFQAVSGFPVRTQSLSLLSPFWYSVPFHPRFQTNLEKEMESRALQLPLQQCFCPRCLPGMAFPLQ